MLQSDVNMILSASDFIPASYVYIGHGTISPLLIQLVSHVRISNWNEVDQIVEQYVYNRTKSINECEIIANNNNNDNETSNQLKQWNPLSNSVDDKHVRDKMRKFLSNQK